MSLAHPTGTNSIGGSTSERPNRLWRREIFIGVTAALTVAVVVAAREVMLPFVLATVIAYLLTPLVARAERLRVPRPVAVLLVYAIVLGSIGGFASGVSPRIGFEFRMLGRELPALVDQARNEWGPRMIERIRAFGLLPPAATQEEPPADPTTASALVAHALPDGSLAIDVGAGVEINETKKGWVIESARDRDRRDKREGSFDPNRLVADAVGRTFAYAQRNSLMIALAVRDVVAGISRFVFVFFITLMLAAYLMVTRERIVTFFRSLVSPSRRPGFDALLTRIDEGLSGVVRGQLVICAINGVLSAIGFAVVGLKYWPVMALIAAVFSLVPIFGSIASAIPAVAIGLTQGLATGAIVLAWIVGVHQLEANLLNPKIMGDAAKIHPVLVIFALLVGEHFFHLVGTLLAVPTMSIVQSVFLHVREDMNLDEPELAVSENLGSSTAR
ncbi:MAG: AI-2E family transporter [Myxococcota bacterium]|nr:AI-2E family transporter [Myxococcota bacterium]